VKLDGKVVCDEKFPFDNAHTYKPFKINLSKGKHTIKVSSKNVGIKFSKEFSFTDEDYGVVTFWYLEESNKLPKKNFEWEIDKGSLAIF